MFKFEGKYINVDDKSNLARKQLIQRCNTMNKKNTVAKVDLQEISRV